MHIYFSLHVGVNECRLDGRCWGELMAAISTHSTLPTGMGSVGHSRLLSFRLFSYTEWCYIRSRTCKGNPMASNKVCAGVFHLEFMQVEHTRWTRTTMSKINFCQSVQRFFMEWRENSIVLPVRSLYPQYTGRFSLHHKIATG
jgi:hypothetical protein